MKLAIVGDSFSCDNGPGSWISLLSSGHKIKNYSQRGISQFRLYKIVQQNLQNLLENDLIILCHTNPDRVYINDLIEFPTRYLSSHPTADLVASDALAIKDKSWNHIIQCHYKIFHCDEQQTMLYNAAVNEIITLLMSRPLLHLSGFPTKDNRITSLSHLLSREQGSINHMSLEGNALVANFIQEKLCDIC